jgi:hypothetical protein
MVEGVAPVEVVAVATLEFDVVADVTCQFEDDVRLFAALWRLRKSLESCW